MRNKKAFTLIELLVVIAIIALLVAILIPALKKVQQQAKNMVCRSNLRQWSLYFMFYTDDNNGSLTPGPGGTDGPRGPGGFCGYWFNILRPYHGMDRPVIEEGFDYKERGDYALALCPMATLPTSEGYPLSTFSAWGIFGTPFDPYGYKKARAGDYGSYGINGWACNPPPGQIYGSVGCPECHWRTALVKGAAYIPLLMDCMWFSKWPDDSDAVPDYSGHYNSEMCRYCIDRHSGGVNSAFVDFSVRRVGLKQLWNLKWNRQYQLNADKPVAWDDPSHWMYKFKNYD